MIGESKSLFGSQAARLSPTFIVTLASPLSPFRLSASQKPRIKIRWYTVVVVVGKPIPCCQYTQSTKNDLLLTTLLSG